MNESSLLYSEAACDAAFRNIFKEILITVMQINGRRKQYDAPKGEKMDKKG